MAVNPEIHLWRAVLLVGLNDAATGRDDLWIGGTDFRLICDLADMDPGAVLSAFDRDRLKRLPRLHTSAA